MENNQPMIIGEGLGDHGRIFAVLAVCCQSRIERGEIQMECRAPACFSGHVGFCQDDGTQSTPPKSLA